MSPPRYIGEVSGANWVTDPPLVQAPRPPNLWLWGVVALVVLKLLK